MRTPTWNVRGMAVPQGIRHSTCWLAALLLAPMLLAAIGRDVKAADRYNILMICVDDMRTDIGCYGNQEVLTPHIDNLATRGVRFDRAYCQQALCNPSRASLLTGRTPDHLKLWNLTKGFRDDDPDIATLPQWFKQHGYFTQGMGKVFHNWGTETQGDPVSWSVPAVYHFARHDDDRPQVDGTVPPDKATAPRCMRLDVPDNAYFDGRIAELAVQALEQRANQPGQPFFLAVGFWKPHLPFNAPKKYWDLYERPKLSMPVHPSAPRGVPEIALHSSREIMRAAPKSGLSPSQVRELRHGYLAGISYLDAQVGKVIEALDRHQLTQNTVVVFWSDHGFHLGENSLWCKTSNFERDARVPLIIVVPDQAERQAHTKSLVELLDLFPTLVELCGLSPPDKLDGTSLLPLLKAPALKDPTTSRREGAFTQHPRPAYYKGKPEVMGVSVRTSRYRYTEWRSFASSKVLATELYDHQTDDGETRNLAAEPDAPANVLRETRRILRQRFPADDG